jgi:phosphoribosylformimino-5-aminoimidazole carboxamide ribotide isomerase
MLIIPAIDLLGGHVVRLAQGREESAVTYGDDPLAVAKTFETAGAHWIHVVDLDGALGRPGVNDAAISALVAGTKTRVELGGGIRSLERAGEWLTLGVGRVVLGSAAVRDPGLMAEAVESFGADCVVAGIDCRDGKVAIHGWKDETHTDAVVLASRMAEAGIIRVIVTDISTDGMLSGPKLDVMIQIAETTKFAVIASGGVGRLEDLDLIHQASSKGIEGAIVGKALYENRFTLKAAIGRFEKAET